MVLVDEANSTQEELGIVSRKMKILRNNKKINARNTKCSKIEKECI